RTRRGRPGNRRSTSSPRTPPCPPLPHRRCASRTPDRPPSPSGSPNPCLTRQIVEIGRNIPRLVRVPDHGGAMQHDPSGHNHQTDRGDRDQHTGHDMAGHDMAGHDMAGHDGHDKHAGHSVAMFRDRFWLSVLLTIPILIWSEMVQDWLGYTAPSFTL